MMSTRPVAHAVPTSTGTTAAGRVRGRAPATQSCQAGAGRGTAAGASAVPPVGTMRRWRMNQIRRMRRLVVVEARGTDAFVDRLRRAWDAGDAVLPLDPRLPPPDRDRVLAAARTGEPVDEGDALVMATSGATGTPKAVVLTHDAVAASARATSARLGVDPDRDCWLACLPLAHVGGLTVITKALHSGTPLVVQDGFDPRAVESAAATLVSLVPTMLRRIDPSGFRAVVLGGSAMPRDLPPQAVT